MVLGENSTFRNTELQTFSYHSGAQISVWFGDIWVSDITSITWQYSQEKRPIYGYASTYFDAVARGQVMVQGNFTINFRQRDYISFVMYHLPVIRRNVTSNFTPSEARDRWKALSSTISSHLRNGTFGPKTYQELMDLGASPTFWETADIYEDILWKGLSEQEDERAKSPDMIQLEEHPDGFDIQVTYGRVSDHSSERLYDVMSSTTKILKGVHLVGTSQVIQANGEPVQEGYSFFAKDLQ